MFRGIASCIALGAVLPGVASIPTDHAISITGRQATGGSNAGAQTPEDYSAIHNFAAIGDSYAAGIGAGTVLSGAEDKACSRYDQAYPILMNSYFNDMTDDGRRNFQFLACSRAKTADIKKQAESLRSDSQDLVTLSAGGNNVNFGRVLVKCVFLPGSDQGCNDALDEAEREIENDLLPSVLDLLEAVDTKMRLGGTVVYTLYARFFNKATTVCDTITWNMFFPELTGGQMLTQDMRTRMNDLVGKTNDKLEAAIAKFQEPGAQRRAKYVSARYDRMFGLLGGRFCEDTGSQDPQYVPEERELFLRNPDQGFIPDQKMVVHSDQPGASAKHANHTVHVSQDLDGRSLVPDDIARNFHPNERGHSVMAVAAINAWEEQRVVDINWAEGDDSKTCPYGLIPEKYKYCTGPPSGESWNGKPWVTRDAIVKAAEDFCDMVINGDWSEKYNDGMSNSLVITISYSAGGNIPKSECLKSLYQVIDGCDVPDMDANPPYNPLNWKYGGSAPLPNGRGFIGFQPNNKWHEDWFCQSLDYPKYVAMQNTYDFAREFCRQAPRGPQAINFTLTGYGATDTALPTLDAVEFKLNIPGGYYFDEDRCNDAFFRLADGCSYDPIENPLNWKHGGTLDSDGVHLEINPQHDRVIPNTKAPSGSCRYLKDDGPTDFWIDGAGYATSDNGFSHNGLHEQLSGCGDLTQWYFTYFDDIYPGNVTEWRVRGRLPPNSKDCVSRAMHAAGGPDEQCQLGSLFSID